MSGKEVVVLLVSYPDYFFYTWSDSLGPKLGCFREVAGVSIVTEWGPSSVVDT